MQVILVYSLEWYPPLDQSARHIALCSSSEVNSGLFLSVRLYGGDVGIYMSMCLTWMLRIWKVRSARGHDRIRDNEFRWEKLDIALVSYELL